jgi:predicted ABC-type ATPase
LTDRTPKRALVIAGPNGAGKTTLAHEFLPAEAGLMSFVNADLIAAGLSPFDPERAAIRAGRLMVRAIAEHVARVAERVRRGGHSVPEAVVRRRFVAGRKNFERIYKRLVDEWRLYDNSGPRPILVDRGENQ